MVDKNDKKSKKTNSNKKNKRVYAFDINYKAIDAIPALNLILPSFYSLHVREPLSWQELEDKVNNDPVIKHIDELDHANRFEPKSSMNNEVMALYVSPSDTTTHSDKVTTVENHHYLHNHEIISLFNNIVDLTTFIQKPVFEITPRHNITTSHIKSNIPEFEKINGNNLGSITEDKFINNENQLTATGQLSIESNHNVHFIETVISGSNEHNYGSLKITPDGHWVYLVDNNQNAIQQLITGETLTEHFIVTTTDGSQEVIEITIHGQNDRAIISGESAKKITEDLDVDNGYLHTSGQLTIQDKDLNQDHFVSNTLNGELGTLTIDENGLWQYKVNNDNPTIQALTNSTEIIEHFIVYSADGTQQQINIQIKGQDDRAHITSNSEVDIVELMSPPSEGNTQNSYDNLINQSYGSVIEDTSLKGQFLFTSGELSIVDPDYSEEQFQAKNIQSEHGSLTINSAGYWEYIADNSQASIQSLGLNKYLFDSLVVESVDGTKHQINITIVGTNDSAIIGGQSISVLREDENIIQGQLHAEGTLTISDIDHDQSHFDAATQSGAYGELNINSDGHWTYLADNLQPAIQALHAGETLTDTLFVHSVDGTQQAITITIYGSEDAALIAGQAVAVLQEDKNTVHDQLRADGALTVSDTDHNQSHFDATTQSGTYGELNINSDGHWTYLADNSQPAIQALHAGETLTDTLFVHSVDGTQQAITITIYGSEDAALISGQAVAVLQEDKNTVHDQLRADGALTVSDTDHNQSHFDATTQSGTYGALSINSDGHWTYLADNSQPTIQALHAGETLTDTLFVHSVDGTQQAITITINGTDDAAVIAGQAVAVLQEDKNAVQGQLRADGALTVSDADHNQSHFDATTLSGAYGELNINSNGHWTYLADNSQPAIQTLHAGETLTDTLFVHSVDGTQQAVTITIYGSEDAALISGQAVAVLQEDKNTVQGQLRADGALSVSDADHNQSHFDATTQSGAYGELSINSDGHWTYLADNSQPTIQALHAGETLTDTLFVHSVDGTQQAITITINGSEDAALITGQAVAVLQEDKNAVQGQLRADGALSVSDTDHNQSHFDATTQSGAYGELSINSDGHWTYLADNSQPAIQALHAGETLTDTLFVHSVDGTQQAVTITIYGSEDAALITGQAVAVLQEDKNTVQGQLRADGALTVSDADHNQSHFDATTLSGAYGELSINSDGHWTYLADNSQPAIQALHAGETLSDTLFVHSVDGTQQAVTVTIYGSEDAALITGQAVAVLQEDKNAVQGQLRADGALTVSDTDHNQSHFDATTQSGAYGELNINSDGHWTYLADNSQPAIQALHAGETLTDTLFVHSVDGTQQAVTITIYGSEDAALITGQAVAVLQEDKNTVQGQLRADGALTVSDADHNQSHFDATTLSGAYGELSINSDGHWTYLADNSQPAIQALHAGETLSDTLFVHSVDGTQQAVTVTIYGSEDAALITGQAVAVLQEDKNAVQGQLRADGALTVSDTDHNQSHFDATTQSGAYGELSINSDGHWTYLADNSQPAIQALHAGETLSDTLFVHSVDGTQQAVTVTIYGSEDAALITGQAVAVLQEDKNTVQGQLRADGALSVSDTDHDQSHFDATTQSGTYGELNINSDGHWTYLADNSQPTIQALHAGETLTDTLFVHSVDGTQQAVTITIYGSEDAALITGQAVAVLQEDKNAVQGQLRADGALSVSDTDHNQSHFDATTQSGAYGELSINSDGHWTYLADNSQPAIQALHAGETLTDTLFVHSVDGTQQAVTITIYGSEDAALITGQAVAVLQEDKNTVQGQLRADGALSVSDTDHNQSHFDATTQSGAYGELSINSDGHWTYLADNSQPAIQALHAGETLTDTLFVHSVDGTQQAITVTINGTDDTAVIAGQAVAVLQEDKDTVQGQLHAKGALTINDNDHDQGYFDATTQSGAYGELNINSDGHWTYLADNSQPVIQALHAGETLTDTLFVHSVDGTQQVITITIYGSEDAALITGQAVAVLQEDKNAVQGQLRADGALTVSDTDHDQSHFDATTQSGTYGELNINSDGHWTYLADNSQPVIQALHAGEALTDTLFVHSVDGTQQAITITINGTDDTAIITGVATGSLKEDILSGTQLQAKGLLTASDKDHDQSSFELHTESGQYGTLELKEDGYWTYTVDNNQQIIQELPEGKLLSETFTVQSKDGTTQQISVDITGTNDTAVITETESNPNLISVTEDKGIAGTSKYLGYDGKLSITDIDLNESHFLNHDNLNVHGYSSALGGHLYISPKGDYSYRIKNHLTKIQQLSEGETVTDTVVVKSADGTTHTVSIVINGNNDLPELSLTSQSPIDGQLNATDVDINDKLTFTSEIASGQFGTLTLNDQTGAYSFHQQTSVQGMTYNAQTDTYHAQQTFKVLVNDGHGGEDFQYLSFNLEGKVTEPITPNGPATISVITTSSNHSTIPPHVPSIPVSQNITLNLPTNQDSGSDHNDHITNINSPHLTGHTDIPFSMVEIKTVNGTVVGQGLSDKSGNYDIQLAPLADQSYKLTAEALAPSAFSPTTTNIMLTVDTQINPLDVSLTHDTGDSVSDHLTNTGELAVTGIESSSLVEYSADNGKTWHTALTQLSDGQHQISVRQTDVAGNVSIPKEITINLDTHINTPTLNAIQNAEHNKNPSPTLTGNGEPGSHIAIYDGSTLISDNLLVEKDGTFSFTPSRLTDGTYNFSVITTDAAGNVSNPSSIQSTLIDTTPPAQLSLSLKVDSGSSNQDLVTNNGDLTIGNVETNAQVYYSTDNGHSWQKSFTPQEGSNNLQIKQIDLAGNESPISVIHFDLDKQITKPTINISSGTILDHIINLEETTDHKSVISGIMDNAPNTEITSLIISDTNGHTIPVDVNTINQQKNGHYSVENLDLSSLSDGSLSLQIVTSDLAGNTSTQSTSIIKDTINTAQDDKNQIHEESTLTASGNVLSNDELAHDKLSPSVTNSGDYTTTYGKLHLHSDGSYQYDLNNQSSEVQALGDNVTVTDTFSIETLDPAGNPKTTQLTIHIHGSNDAAVIGGTTIGEVTEDNSPDILSTQGQLTIHDIDTNSNILGGEDHFIAETISESQHYGQLTINENGQWNYELDNTLKSIQALKDKDTLQDVFTVHSADGTTENITINILGNNDVPELYGASSGNITEKGTTPSGGMIKGNDTASGVITATDADTNDTLTWFIEQPNSNHSDSKQGIYGSFSIDQNGHWTYQLNNTENSAADSLKANQQETEVFTVHAVDHDGAEVTKQITINIQGSNDQAQIQGNSTVNLQEDHEQNSKNQLHANGTLTVIDRDNDESHFQATTTQGKFGSLTLTEQGHWTYLADNSQQAIQELKGRDHIDDVFTIKSADGTEQNITITINGTNDLPTINASQDTGSVIEGGRDAHQAHGDNSFGTQGHMKADGQLTAIEIDKDDPAHWVVTQSNNNDGNDGQYGRLTINSNSGKWTYELDDIKADSLQNGDIKTEVFTVTDTDSSGTPVEHTVTITITGSNDMPVITGDSKATVYEEGDNYNNKNKHPTQAHGQLKAQDPDHNDTLDWSIANNTNNTQVNQLDGKFGQLTLDKDGQWHYITDNRTESNADKLHLNETATDEFIINATDSSGHATQQVITITLQGSNDNPVISSPDAKVIKEGSGKYKCQIDLATDVDNTDTLSYSSSFEKKPWFTLDHVTGQYTVNTNHAHFQHLSETDQQRLDIDINVKDNHGGHASTSLSITIKGTNDSPKITSIQDQNGKTLQLDHKFNLNEDTQISGTVLFADKDDAKSQQHPHGDTYTFSNPNNIAGFTIDAKTGAYTLDATDVSYQHLQNGQQEHVQVKVQVIDNHGAQSIKTLNFTVHGTNDSPTVSNNNLITQEDTSIHFTLGHDNLKWGKPLVDIVDVEGDKLDISNPTVDSKYGHIIDHGMGQFEFKPNDNINSVSLNGDVPISFLVNDNHGAKVTQQGFIHINPVNDAPTAGSVIVLDPVTEDTITSTNPIIITSAQLLANSHDIDNSTNELRVDNLTLTHGKGTLSGDSVNGWTFVPDKDWNSNVGGGDIRFNFDVVDPDGLKSSQQGSATLHVDKVADSAHITIGTPTDNNVTDSTVSSDREASGQLNIIDPDKDEAGFQVVSSIQGQHGFASIDKDGHWHYTLNTNDPDVIALGENETTKDNFAVHAIDGTEFTISIEIHGTNNEPIVIHTPTVSVTESTPQQTDTQVSGQLNAHDLDNSDQLTFALTNPVEGLTLDKDGHYHFDTANLSYNVLKEGQRETVTAHFTVTDQHNAVVSDTLTFSVFGTNDAPIVTSVPHFHTYNHSAITFHSNDLLAGAQDPDNDLLSLMDVKLANPQAGTITEDGSGGYTYTPSKNFKGDVDLDFFVTDGHEKVASHTTISVAPKHISQWQQFVNWINHNFNHNTHTNNGHNTTSHTIHDDIHGSIVGNTDENTDHPDTAASGDLTVIREMDNHNPHQVNVIGANHISGQYGYLSIKPSGQWTYHLYPHQGDNDKVNQLQVGESLTDTMLVMSAYGKQNIVITINGSDDKPHITSATNHIEDMNGKVLTNHHSAEVDNNVVKGEITATDVDHGDVLTYTVDNSVSAHPDFVINQNGEYTFTPTSTNYGNLLSGQSQVVEIPIIITDQKGLTDTQTIKITIQGHNHAPKVSNSNVVINETKEDTPVTLTTEQLLQLAGATDFDHDALHIVDLTLTDKSGNIVSIVDHGNGDYEIKPLENQHGTVHISYKISDGHSANVPITGTMQVLSVNDKPTAENFKLATIDESTSSNSTQHTFSTKDLLIHATDVDIATDQDSIHLQGSPTLVDPTQGSLVNQNGKWLFTAHDANLNGNVSIQYTVQDKAGETATATATLHITPTNDAAIIHPVNTESAQEDTKIKASGSLSISDVDSPDQAHFIANSHINGSHGYLSINNKGEWEYELTRNHESSVQAIGAQGIVTEHFTITSKDGTTYQLAVDIKGSNDNPILSVMSSKDGNEGASSIQGQIHASDVDKGDGTTTNPADILTYQTLFTHAGFSLNPQTGAYSLDLKDPIFDSMHVGETQTLRVPITVLDNNGGTSTTQNLVITVTGTNDVPVIHAIQAQQVNEGSSLLKGTIGSTDIDNDNSNAAQTTYSIGNNQSIAGFSLNSDGSYQFDPTHAHYDHLANGVSETIDISIIATDQHHGHSLPKTLSITIIGTNDSAVIAGATQANLIENNSQTINGDLTITDKDDNEMRFVALDHMQPDSTSAFNHYGELDLDQNGHWQYNIIDNDKFNALPEGQTIVEHFTVHSIDGTPQIITITLTGSNDAPTLIASNPVVITPEGLEDTTSTINIEQFLVNAQDVDSDDKHLHIDSVTALHGTVTADNKGIHYTPNSNFNGEETFSYHVVDSHGAYVEASAKMNIAAVADAGIVTINNITQDDTINLDESQQDITLTGTATGGDIQAGDKVHTTINQQTYTGVVDANGHWEMQVAGSDIAQTPQLTVIVDTQDGASHIDSTSQHLVAVDTSVATQATIIGFESQHPAIINAAEAQHGTNIVAHIDDIAGLSDLSKIEVLIDGNMVNYIEPSTIDATTGEFKIALTGDQLASATDKSISLNLIDVHGNELTTSNPHVYSLDITPPSIQLDPLNGILNQHDRHSDLVLSGSTHPSESGQSVLIQFAQQEYHATVDALGHFSVIVPSTDLTKLNDNSDYSITATMTDLVGNPSLPAQALISTDFKAEAQIKIDDIAGDNILNQQEVGDPSASHYISGFITGDINAVPNQFVSIFDQNTNTVIGSGKLNSFGHFSIPVNNFDLYNTETIRVDYLAIDEHGNQNTVSQQVSYQVDMTPPQVDLDYFTIDTDALINGITISGHSLDAIQGQEVQIDFNGQHYALTTDQHGQFSQHISANDLQNIDQSTPLYDLNVQVTDSAGNINEYTHYPVINDNYQPLQSQADPSNPFNTDAINFATENNIYSPEQLEQFGIENSQLNELNDINNTENQPLDTEQEANNSTTEPIDSSTQQGVNAYLNILGLDPIDANETVNIDTPPLDLDILMSQVDQPDLIDDGSNGIDGSEGLSHDHNDSDQLIDDHNQDHNQPNDDLNNLDQNHH